MTDMHLRKRIVSSLLLAIGIAAFLSGCSTASKRSARHVGQPIAPVRGDPINSLNLKSYLKVQCANLVREGRIGTNLLSQANHQTCGLKLALPPARALTGPELIEKAEMNVAVIVLFGKRGKLVGCASGFFLTESGALATCKHVVADKRVKGMAVMTRDGRVCPVREVLAIDATNDVAIVQVEGQGFAPASVAAAVRPGSPVWVISHPAPGFTTSPGGLFPATILSPRGLLWTSLRISRSAPAARPSSMNTAPWWDWQTKPRRSGRAARAFRRTGRWLPRAPFLRPHYRN